MGIMKAITLWQPWASLLACGAKRYETRSWPTRYRGIIANHSAKRKADPITFTKPFLEVLAPTYTVTPQGDFIDLIPTGCVLSTAELIACWRIAEQVDGGVWVQEVITGQRKHIITLGNEGLFGDFTPGRYAWEFANMTMLPEPIPAKGGQRIWNWEVPDDATA